MNAPPPLFVEKVNNEGQFRISNTHLPLEDFDREYVSFSGYSGQYSPTLFAEAPAMLEALQFLSDMCDQLINEGWGGDIPCSNEEKEGFARVAAILARIDGGAA